jgi:hypothetical protein
MFKRAFCEVHERNATLVKPHPHPTRVPVRHLASYPLALLKPLQAQGQPCVGEGEEVDRERTDAEQRRGLVGGRGHDARRERRHAAHPCLLRPQQLSVEQRLGGEGARGVDG